MLLGEEGLNHNPLNTMSYLSFPLQSNAAQIAGGTLLALLAFAPLFAGELEPSLRSTETSNPQSLSTQIDHVVVYQQGAQVERVAPVKLNPGLTTVIFSKLNTAIDPAQLRLTGDGDFQVLSISHRYQTDTLSGATTASRVRELQRQSSKLQKKIGPIEARKLIFNREEQLLLNNQGFTVKDSGVDLERLMQASTFFRERFEAIQKGRLEIDTEISRIQEEIADLNAAMQALPNLQTETFLEILVNVDAVKATNGEMLLSYWMNNAGWNPSYNARVSEITEPLKLEYQALVYQNTGEEWGDVGLSIATGTPSKNRSKPQLQPWSLDGRQGPSSTFRQRQCMVEIATIQPKRARNSRPIVRRERPTPHWRKSRCGIQCSHNRHQWFLFSFCAPRGQPSDVQFHWTHHGKHQHQRSRHEHSTRSSR